MAAKGYTTVDAVGLYVGQGTLADDQAVLATSLLPLAEDYIDHETQGNGGWLNGPITSELYTVRNVGHQFTLRSTPVTSIQSIYRRSRKVGDTPILLVSGTDYELLDAANGIVLLADSVFTAAGVFGFGANGYGDPAWSSEWGNIGGVALATGTVLQVSYTPVQTVPPVITQAATMLVAHWLEYNIFPQRFAVASYKSADISYSTPSSGGAGGSVRVVPQEINDLLNDFSAVHF